ncbi:MAG: FHA domain-containing protein [Phycisphaerae bacterium]
MFERLTMVRLKTAEEALVADRIDEAFGIVSAPDLAVHRRGRRLFNKLGGRFLERGQDHLLNRRFPEALADFERAGRCGASPEKVTEWRDRAVAAMEQADRSIRDRAAALADARQRMAAGSLDGAAAALDDVSERDPAREQVAQAIDERSDRARAALAAARAAVQQDDLTEAVRRFQEASQLYPRMDGMAEMETTLVGRVVERAADCFTNGRLDRAAQDLAILGDVGRNRTERMELHDALQLATDAAKAIAGDRYGRAGVLLGRLGQLGPHAEWVSKARDQLAALEGHRRALLEGPLGLLSGRDDPSVRGHDRQDPAATLPAPRKVRGAPPVIDAARRPADGSLPGRMLLRVDGVGSFLLLPRERISIGRAGPGATADLQLVSDLSERQAEIVRTGDDYFVMAASGVELAGRAVEHALLQDGDRIRLGRRVRLKFRRPSLKSCTAVLDLMEGVRTTTDCRRVILLGGPLLMGNRRECHVLMPTAAAGAVLVCRGGRLVVKTMGAVRESTPVELGAPFEVAGVRMSVQAWPEGSGTGRVIG